MVIIPRIEYRSKISVFNSQEATEMTTKLRKLIRYKIGVENTAPNVLLKRKELYNF